MSLFRHLQCLIFVIKENNANEDNASQCIPSCSDDWEEMIAAVICGRTVQRLGKKLKVIVSKKVAIWPQLQTRELTTTSGQKYIQPNIT